jgi:AcrR family transcriptional regulator
MSVIHRERVLRAATSSFLARGYASSVDDIARRARVAKQTVYQHFASKDELFKAVARELAQRVIVGLEGTDVRESLLRFALEYRRRALGADGIATFRTVVPEVPRFRSLARAMYANTAGEMVRRLAEFLARAHADRVLRVPDPEF